MTSRGSTEDDRLQIQVVDIAIGLRTGTAPDARVDIAIIG